MLKIIFANLHLEKIGWIIKSKLKYMVLFALVGGILGGVYATFLGETVYRADITLHVYSKPEYVNDTGINIAAGELQAAANLISNYRQVLIGSKFLEEVIKTAGLDGTYTVAQLKSEIGSSPIDGTQLFTVSVYDPNPKNAQLIANTIGAIAPDVLVGLVKSGGIAVLDEAQLPKAPFSSTSTVKTALIGAGVLGILSCLFFLGNGLKDTRIRRKYEIEDMFTIPIIGTVPDIDRLNTGETKELNENSSFKVVEAYSEIRSNLLNIDKEEKCPVFAITSADPGEGKSTTAINTAKSFARIGKKVLLIDADMRFSVLAERLGLENKGLSEYLLGKGEIKIQKHEGEPDIITAGEKSEKATDLISGASFEELLDKLKADYEVIIVDLPPVGRATDAVSFIKGVTAYVLVLREFITRFDREEMIVSRIERLEGEICGFIFNAISPDSEDYNFRKQTEKFGYRKKN